MAGYGGINSTHTEVFTADPSGSLLKNLTVRVLDPHEYQRAGELLDQEHYLGDVPQGRQLFQVVEHQGQWVALLDWGSATWKLADREEWIGWTAQQRAQRHSLVVLNRRFLVLGKTRMPNLASKSLRNQWLQAHLGTLPRALAIDGKWIRDRALSLCLSDHETGAPVAMGLAKEKTPKDNDQSQDDYKREGEQTVALRLYETTHLENATVTGDALNNNKSQAQAVLDAGGDYFFQLKNDNRHAYKAAAQKAKGTPLLPTPMSPTPVTDA